MIKPKMKIGTITFGKSRRAPKAVLVDVTFDDKTGNNLFKLGLKLIQKDKDTVIEYVIRRALEKKKKK